jgi:NAD(P)-dependent dehydrogenase (short-subunit alcohol dehydrogenase family)
VVIAAKTTSDPSSLATFPPDPNSNDSTINTVAREINEAGGQSLAIKVDTRSVDSVNALFTQVVDKFARMDVLVYNSGAIWWSSVEKTPYKRFKLIQEVKVEGLYACMQAAMAIFQKTHWRARVVVVCPPIYSRFFRGKTAYAVGKVGMSVLVKGLAMDWEREGKEGMAISGIWPSTAIQSAATEQFQAQDASTAARLRKPAVFAEAIVAMLRAPEGVVNGVLTTDEDFLREHCGVVDFAKYSVVEGSNPPRIMPLEFPVLEVAEQDDEGRRVDSTKMTPKEKAKV